MRLVCAGCQKTLGHVCPFCSAKLEMEVIDGRTWYRCHETMTTIYFDPDNMKTRNALCDTCQVNGFNAREENLRLSFEDQQTIAALDGAGNRGNGARRTRRLTPLDIVERANHQKKENESK